MQISEKLFDECKELVRFIETDGNIVVLASSFTYIDSCCYDINFAKVNIPKDLPSDYFRRNNQNHNYKNFYLIINSQDKFVKVLDNSYEIFSSKYNSNEIWLCNRFILRHSGSQLWLYDPYNNMKKVFHKNCYNLYEAILNENFLVINENYVVKVYDISMFRDVVKFEKFRKFFVENLGKDVTGIVKEYLN